MKSPLGFQESRTTVENKTADIKMQIKRRGNLFYVDVIEMFGLIYWFIVVGAQNPFRGINLYKGPVDMSYFPSNAGGYCLWSKIPLELLYISWENSPNFGLGYRADMISTIAMRSCFLKLSCLNEDKCLMIATPQSPETVIRLQLETLLAEKARLANKNSVYTRENRFLREIVEYHQLTLPELCI
ncbi:hypothetical protein ACFX13_033192 [Malus domestica]